MINFLITKFKKGIERIKKNPQLIYTLFVAIIIFFAFLYTSNNFLLIARNAQEKLINVRMGSMQDVFTEFVLDYIDKPEELLKKINNIKEDNETIEEFRVVLFQNDKKIILASLKEEEIGSLEQENYLYDFSFFNPQESFTNKLLINNNRYFETVRAIVNNRGEVIGAIYTKQTLSQADQIINQSIKNGIFVLIIILILIMFLFFRHAKIIDYAVLYKKLNQVNRMKDDFISIATHELRTPLTIIRGYAEFLKSSKLKKEEEEMIDNINTQAERLVILVDDMLDVPKIEQGKMYFNLEKTDVKKEIENVINFLKNNAQEKGLKLYAEFNDSAFILADKNRLKQILINIIGNAVKYTQKGEIKVITEKNKDNLVIKVIDTGIGMSAEDQKRLFQKFYRIRSKETNSITGTGLGLWLTKKMINLMKGSISIESIRGVGTHVIISFPIKND